MLPRFDAVRFAKVRALHDRTDSSGERESAERAMRALAEAAGLSLADALAADASAGRAPSDPMREVFDTPRQRAEREQRRRIFDLVERGASDRRIARQLGVARSVVRAVRRAMLR